MFILFFSSAYLTLIADINSGYRGLVVPRSKWKVLRAQEEVGSHSPTDEIVHFLVGCVTDRGGEKTATGFAYKAKVLEVDTRSSTMYSYETLSRHVITNKMWHDFSIRTRVETRFHSIANITQKIKFCEHIWRIKQRRLKQWAQWLIGTWN